MGEAMKEFLEVGEIVTVHGLRGEMKLYPWTDQPSTLNHVKTLYTGPDGSGPLHVRVHDHGRMALCKAEGVDTPEQARRYVGKVLYAARQDIPLAEGRVFLADLPGLRVLHDETGEELGIIVAADASPANDIYTIRLKDGRECLIPAVREFVREIDLAGGYIRLRPIRGMLSDED